MLALNSNSTIYICVNLFAPLLFICKMDIKIEPNYTSFWIYLMIELKCHVCVYIYMCVCIYIYICACVVICVYIHMYVCLCIKSSVPALIHINVIPITCVILNILKVHMNPRKDYCQLEKHAEQ